MPQNFSLTVSKDIDTLEAHTEVRIYPFGKFNENTDMSARIIPMSDMSAITIPSTDYNRLEYAASLPEAISSFIEQEFLVVTITRGIEQHTLEREISPVKRYFIGGQIVIRDQLMHQNKHPLIAWMDAHGATQVVLTRHIQWHPYLDGDEIIDRTLVGRSRI